MQKIIICSLLALMVAANNLKAGNAAYFNINEENISAELSLATQLESQILAGSQDLVTPGIVAGMLELTTGHPAGLTFGLEDMEWGSFAWGFCCWPVGVFTVLLSDEKDTNHKISYFIGIGAAVVFGGISRFTLWYLIY